ncbi:signal peptidase II [Pedobacter changchengzhani]|uniref:Lipoprotein signal peptidase n=1 Tax=Pedobacter changchengzhani TaxID=2529274 RepID=A0A4R5MPT5_9SPHI|nr:signal peptidase II [Pedobacter changchengzhani]TDG37870.1 signal peptidase II [Pedobacter changchengzhani]
MNFNSTRRIVLLLVFIFIAIGFDQVSKIIVRNKLNYNEQISVIKDRFILVKIENSGAFLSLGDGMPTILKFIVLSGLPLIALGYGLYYLYSRYKQPIATQIALCFVIGGGVGNLYDRIMYGSVTDFMHLDFYLFRTGIFNFADVFIMIGIGILLLQSFVKNKDLVATQNEAID